MPLPLFAELGLIDESTGTGLFALVMVNVAPAEVAPPGLSTLTVTVDAVAISEAGTTVVNCVEEINVVDIVLPPQLTVAPLRNPVPLTVIVN